MSHRLRLVVLSLVLAAAMARGDDPQPGGRTLTGKDALGDWTTDAPGVRRKRHAGTLVVEHAPADGDATGIGPRKARDEVEDRALAGARAPEERGDAPKCILALLDLAARGPSIAEAVSALEASGKSEGRATPEREARAAILVALALEWIRAE